MSFALVPAAQAKPLATTGGKFKNVFAAALSASAYAVLSIKGSKWHKIKGDSKELICRPGTDEYATSLEVVVVRANPNKSKVFYAQGYEEGSVAKPTCYSNSGISPEADAQEPQAKKCATCAHNQWGSKITENGKKTKACADSFRLAVATVDDLENPMLLRIPAGSFTDLGVYGGEVSKYAEMHHTLTKIGFDPTVAYPKLTFKRLGHYSAPDAVEALNAAHESDVAKQITGELVGEVPVNEDVDPNPVAAVATKAISEAKKQAAKVEDEDYPATPKATIKKEADAPKPAKKVEVSAEQAIDESLDDLDFDD